ncbi:hypothetical protein K438DRAFT_1753388 [Mycena galopus ATCC 62051]|nr:hypothetical protein K438DRAFT_1753388 [Mycena galopus ATCC 62051]
MYVEGGGTPLLSVSLNSIKNSIKVFWHGYKIIVFYLQHLRNHAASSSSCSASTSKWSVSSCDEVEDGGRGVFRVFGNHWGVIMFQGLGGLEGQWVSSFATWCAKLGRGAERTRRMLKAEFEEIALAVAGAVLGDTPCKIMIKIDVCSIITLDGRD